MTTPNQTPEQRARDCIDVLLQQAGWQVQNKKVIDFSVGPGIAVREYQTDIGPADYFLIRLPVHAGFAAVEEAVRVSDEVVDQVTSLARQVVIDVGDDG